MKTSLLHVLVVFLFFSLSENRLRAENRLEVRGDRLEATNQVIEYRVQETGTNQCTEYSLQNVGNGKAELPLGEINQRVESTTNYELRTANCDDNQVTGNRLQGTGNRRQRTDNEKIALSIPEKPENPSFQIGQRVESTTNCQLPTANCDNGIRCHLMMDPSSTSKLGEGMKALSRFVKPSVYPEEEGAISAAVRIKPSAVPSNSSSYAKYVVPENTSVAAYGDIAGQQQEDSVSPEAKEFEAHFSKMIADAKDQARSEEQEAEEVLPEAKEKAGKLEAQKRKRAWENVIGKATDAETAYKTVIQLYMQYRGYLAQYYTGEILNSKRVQYNQDQKQAAVKRDYWVNEIKNANECLQGRQIPDSNFETEEVVNASDQTHLSVDKQIPMTSIHHEKDKSLFSQFENNNQINTVSVENR